MDPTEFRIHSAYDHQVLKAMSRVLRRTLRRKRSIAYRIFGWTALLLTTLLQVGLLLIDEFYFQPFVFAVYAFVLAALLFEDDLNAWSASLNLIPGTREADTLFTSDSYIVTTQAAETHWHYAQIVALCETKDAFFIFVSKRHVQQFPKAGMESGTPEQFRAFLTEKTGLPVRYVKSFGEKERKS